MGEVLLRQLQELQSPTPQPLRQILTTFHSVRLFSFAEEKHIQPRSSGFSIPKQWVFSTEEVGFQYRRSVPSTLKAHSFFYKSPLLHFQNTSHTNTVDTVCVEQRVFVIIRNKFVLYADFPIMHIYMLTHL